MSTISIHVFSFNPDFIKIKTFVDQHKAFREKSGSISLNLPNVDVRNIDEKVQIAPQKTSPSRDFVAEIMITAGRAISQYVHPCYFQIYPAISFPNISTHLISHTSAVKCLHAKGKMLIRPKFYLLYIHLSE